MRLDGPGEVPAPPPPLAAHVFGEQLPLAQRYVDLLADTGIRHGLVGPREGPRLWERHVLNCAVVRDLVPVGSTVIDVGSGAGLPGLVLAIARPDLTLHLVEPLLRRTTWLEQTVGELGLPNVSVHRARATDVAGTLRAPVVTARAVARLAPLADWCLPLLEPHGRLLALKGASAAAELEEDRAALSAYDVVRARVVELGGELQDPTDVLEITMGAGGGRRTGSAPRPKPDAGAAANRRRPGRGARDRRSRRG